MKKRCFSLFLALAMLFALAAPTLAAEPAFADVAADAWYAPAVQYVQEHDLMQGTGADRFSPEQSVTRAMLVTVLYRAAGSPETTAVPAFQDVEAGEWYTPAIAWASQEEIVQGYGNGLFGVEDLVSREQLATVLWRYAGSPETAAAPDFADAGTIASWAAPAAAWAKAEGIMNGRDGNRFAPQAALTRGELATVLQNGQTVLQPSTQPSGGTSGSGGSSSSGGSGTSGGSTSGGSGSGDTPAQPAHTLVAYYSATHNTQAVAETIADHLDADLFVITPAQPYTDADLNWTNQDSRVCREHNDPALQTVALETATPENWADYDIVFIGYPIWWGNASWVVSSFVSANDFTGKTVIPFCTSSSSGLGESGALLAQAAGTGNWLEGQRFRSGVAAATVTAWLDGLNLSQPTPSQPSEEFEVETPGHGPADASNITSVEGVPLITLNNGVQMPQFGLGTQIQSLENGDLGVLNQTSREAVAAALRSGYRHLDDAHGYLQERGVGQGIRDSGVPREEIWITDKLWPSDYADADAAIDAMLDRLGVDYIDLLYLHHPSGTIDTIVGAWQAMERAYRAGKIRALGISNFDNRMEAFNAIMEQEIKPQIMQIECHPFAQRLETRELAERYNIQVECWYPLGHADQRLLNAETLENIAAAHNKSVVQVIIRWHIQEGFSVIPGSTNPDHIQENIEVFDFELTDEEMAQIRAMDEGEDGRYFNLGYGDMIWPAPREWDGEFPAA